MDLFAEIAVNISGIDGVFDYRIPDSMQEKLQPGCLVEIPYNEMQAQGIVSRIKEKSDYSGELKVIIKMIKPTPVLPEIYLQLAEQLAAKFHQPLASFLQGMLPPGLSRKPYMLYSPEIPDEADLKSLNKVQLSLINTLTNKGALRSTQLDRIFSRQNWRKAMQLLLRNGWVASKSILPDPKITRKKVSTVLLHPDLDPTEIDNTYTGKENGAPAERRKKMLRILAGEKEPTSASYLYAATGGDSSDIRFMEKKGLILIGEETITRDPVQGVDPEGTLAPVLTADQSIAWNAIRHELENSSQNPVMLRGITGSGKTELYLKASEEIVNREKQVLILVPEIALTPQTIQRFLDRFPGRVGVFHSRLSDGERHDTWHRASKGEIQVLIGPRSALLVPLPAIGLIVLDECHDDSYYQLEQTPLYDSRDGALLLSQLTTSTVIFGSATPNVTRFFQAQREHWKIVHLEKRIASRKIHEAVPMDHIPLPPVDVVDMRTELTRGNTSIFSTQLQNALKDVVEAGQQAILFLNRRGSATIIFCRDCGFTMNCPRCDFPLTFYRSTTKLMCHTCGYARGVLQTCPECKGKRIRQYGIGTEEVEHILKKLIPEIRVLRWDADSVTGKNAEGVILSHFKNHNADVLVGTQMLSKGLDLPLVTLVGVVLADVGLNFPDYRAAERAFQLLTQVSGRAGRSQLGGKVILQTFQPEHYAIQFAAKHDFHGFYTNELDRRREIQYPPFTQLIQLETRDLYAENAERRALALANEISGRIENTTDRTLEIIGPVPPFFARQRGYYRWQIILKGYKPDVLLEGLSLSQWQVTVNPPRIL